MKSSDKQTDALAVRDMTSKPSTSKSLWRSFNRYTWHGLTPLLGVGAALLSGASILPAMLVVTAAAIPLAILLRDSTPGTRAYFPRRFGSKRLAKHADSTPITGRSFSGTVADQDVFQSPAQKLVCVAFQTELHDVSRTAGHVTLIVDDAHTDGFEVQCDSGDRIVIPEGTIELLPPPIPLSGYDAHNLLKHFERFDYVREPYNQVRESVVRVADRVTVTGEMTAEFEQVDGSYREAPRQLFRPVGIASITVEASTPCPLPYPSR